MKVCESLTSQGFFLDLTAHYFSPVFTPEELTNNPQIKHRQMIEVITHPEVGAIIQIGNPIKLSNSPVTTRRHAPGLGEHTNEILKELGF